jgi:UDP-N-acetylmuramate: L-alanyl-gamma-D-glutamyl-meso-diaminopimelate ligase
MPEAIWHFFLRDRCTLMVAGTHGKTTSTSIMAQVLHASGRDPGMLVGGIAKNFDSNFYLGSGTHFVIEGDEYDTAFFDKGPKFLHYHPKGTIITAVEFDHADIYRDLEHVKSSFKALTEQLDSTCVMAVSADSSVALEVSENTRAKRLTFGLHAGEFRAVDIRVDGGGDRFSVVRGGQTVTSDIELPVGGRMNVANALGVYVLLREFGLSGDEIRAGLKLFLGVVRRQELVGEAWGVTVIDDFAHHPTAIQATLEAIAERFPTRRILAAFEPRSNTSRRNVFQNDFGKAFARASSVYLGPVFFKENDPIPEAQRLDTAKLTTHIRNSGPEAFACDSNDEVLQRMLSDARPGDVALFMSNGPFGNLKESFLEALKSRPT